VWNVEIELTNNQKQRRSKVPTFLTTEAGNNLTEPQIMAEEYNRIFVSIEKK